MYAVGVIVFLLGVALSIALHECGHMIPAKIFGVKVPQFFVGFGPTVWSTKRGETEYGLKAIPLGGYVKLVGMLPPEPNHDPTEVRTSNTGWFTQLQSDARQAEYEHVDPAEFDRLFYRKPWWQKVIVMLGGPFVNLAIAVILFSISFMGFGVQMPTMTVSTVSDCVITADQAGRACTADDPRSPAAIAGLQAGDEITSFNGQAVTNWDKLVTLIRDNGDKTAAITYTRDGSEHTVDVATTVAVRPSLDNPKQSVSVGFLGVSPGVAVERQGPMFVVDQMGSMIAATGSAILHLPANMVNVAQSIVGGHRNQDGPISVVGASRVAGELVTVDKPSLAESTQRILTLLAGLNLFLWLFNLIPLQPLDGGHVAGALWEALRRGFAKLRGRPDPGYVDVAKALPVAYLMWTALMIMGVTLILADIVNPVKLT